MKAVCDDRGSQVIIGQPCPDRIPVSLQQVRYAVAEMGETGRAHMYQTFQVLLVTIRMTYRNGN